MASTDEAIELIRRGTDEVLVEADLRFDEGGSCRRHAFSMTRPGGTNSTVGLRSTSVTVCSQNPHFQFASY